MSYSVTVSRSVQIIAPHAIARHSALTHAVGKPQIGPIGHRQDQQGGQTLTLMIRSDGAGAARHFIAFNLRATPSSPTLHSQELITNLEQKQEQGRFCYWRILPKHRAHHAIFLELESLIW